ncbi:DUF6878 family protein [Paracoccus binzhouensis]|uniref:DUF6878 family protein n=1 Tax=Paracoccus binzhouensis TaxID=2796149 RepID=UPI0018EF2300|nr:DUF6878 family protein [Paracoccus binzhouensis]
MTDNAQIPPVTDPQPSEWERLAALRNQLEEELFSRNKTALFNALTDAGITHVVVSFDGYGDSGQIEDVETRAGDDSIAMPTATIEIAQAAWGQAEPERATVSIADAIESLAYAALEQTHCGSENNDGAYGDITFDTASRTISLDYKERYTASENYTHTF